MIEAPNKILIIRLSSIGDIILTTPVIRILKQHFPNSQIDFVIKKQFADLLKNHPSIDKLIIFDNARQQNDLKRIKREIKQQQYDLIIDLHKNFRSYFLTINGKAKKVLRYKKFIVRRWLLVSFKWNLFKQSVPIYLRYLIPLKKLGFKYDNLGLDIFVDKKTKQLVEKKYADFFNQNFEALIGIAPGASFFTKRWTSQGFEAVINHFGQRKKLGIILFGNEADRELIETLNITNNQSIINAAGELSIIESAALMDKCDLLLTNDSGLMHLASALKKKVVAIFGSTTRELGFFPTTTEHIVIENLNAICRPCSHVGKNNCPKKHFDCIKKIHPAQVIGAVETLLFPKS